MKYFSQALKSLSSPVSKRNSSFVFNHAVRLLFFVLLRLQSVLLHSVLIEKILRTVPDAGKIFLLIRAKNKEAAMERSMVEIINSELFKCLQQAHGRSYQALMLSKLVPVVGNVCDSNLGLDEDLANVPRKEVKVIINSTANTTFDKRQESFHFLH
ncbi:Fatty acyl-coenzyme A reductase, NAD-binding domain, partial [Dillenia turbinata]